MTCSRRGKLKLLALVSTAGAAFAPAAAVIGAASLTLAPATALAANECVPIGVDPTVNGAAPDTYACAGNYAGGITYSSSGALTVNSTGAMNVGATGVNLTGNTTDAVTFTATGTITGTAGPAIEVVTASGPIVIQAAGITANSGTATHGIRANSTGGGAINVATTGTVNVNSNTVTSLLTGIEAITTGGNGAVTVTTTGSVTGRIRGIHAQASGTGALTINAGAAVGVNTTTTAGGIGQVAAIDVTTGTGLLTVDLAAGAGSVNGTAGSGILANAGGNAVITVGTGRTAQVSSASLGAVFDLTVAGTKTITNNGTVNAGSFTNIAIRATGGALTYNNNGSMNGVMALTAMTGAATINNNAGAIWRTRGTNAFAAGTDVVDNKGTLSASAVSGLVAGATTFTGLETFRNSGDILVGTGFVDPSDAVYGSVLSAPGADFIATGDSRLVLNVDLGSFAPQTECVAGVVTVSDCFDLSGGSTSGQTLVTIASGSDAATIAHNPAGFTLVDVGGGTSQAGDFILDPDSENYVLDPVLGGSIKKGGLFAYILTYDADTQRHILATAPRSETVEFVPFVQSAQSIWHSTAEIAVDRQSDVRTGASGGAWVRVTGDFTSREQVISHTAFSDTFVYDNDYELYTGAAVVGFDFFSAASGGVDYAVGGYAGYVGGTLDIDASPTSDQINGVVAGLYASWWTNDYFLDVAANGNLLNADHSVLSLADIIEVNIVSLGARAEAGRRFALGAGVFAEPLVSLAYAAVTMDDVLLAGADVVFDEADTFRGAVGLKLGADAAFSGLNVSYWAVGKAWNEFAGEGRVLIENDGETLAFMDDLSGGFGEAEAGVSLYGADNSLWGFVSSGVKFKDGLQAINLSAGIRFRW